MEGRYDAAESAPDGSSAVGLEPRGSAPIDLHRVRLAGALELHVEDAAALSSRLDELGWSSGKAGRWASDGELDGRLSVAGTLARPSLVAEISSHELALASGVAVALEARAGIDGRRVHLHAVNLQVGSSQASGQGSYDLDSSAIEGSVEAITTDLAELGEATTVLLAFDLPPLGGRAQMTLGLDGSTAAPRIEANVRGDRLHWGNESEATLDANIRWRSDRLEVESLDLRSRNNTHSLSFAYSPLPDSIDGFLKADFNAVEEFLPIAPASSLTLLQEIPLRGAVHADLSFSGARAFPAVGGRLTTRDLRFGELGSLEIDGELRAERGVTRIEVLEVRLQGSRVSGSGSTSPSELDLTFDIDLASLDVLKPALPSSLGAAGAIVASGRVEGTPENPRVVVRAEGYGVAAERRCRRQRPVAARGRRPGHDTPDR